MEGWGLCKSWTLDSGLDSWTGLWTGLWTEFWTEFWTEPLLLRDVTVCKWLKLLLKCPGPWQRPLKPCDIYACSKRVAMHVDQQCNFQDLLV